MFPSTRTTGSPIRHNQGTSASSSSSWVVAFLLPLLWFSRPAGAHACPHVCLCASDVISCSGGNLSQWPRDVPPYTTHLDLSHNLLASLPANWSAPRTLRRLASLLLSRNAIAAVEADAFALTPHLVHLDLSSNRLAALEASAFASGALARLEVLLLFGNRIAAVEPGAWAGLRSLRRLYLSGNRLTSFPLELFEGQARPGNLSLVDLSSNALTRLPVQSLLSLGERQQGGLYLQGNPLVCDCALLALLQFWCWRRYRPLVDFRAEYPCGLNGDGERGGGAGGEGTCTDLQPNTQESYDGGVYQIEPGDWLTVPCPGLAPPLPENQTVFWLTPGEVLNSSSAAAGVGDHGNDSLRRLCVLPGGALEIRGALAADSGVYTCVAARGHLPDPGGRGRGGGEVSILVGNESGGGGGAGGADGGGAGGRGAEHFNTAFTTLASCVVSIVLVLLYLYLTPCRCRGDRGRGGGERGCGGRAILLCSDPREVDSGERRSNGKRVAFLEPQTAEVDSDRAGGAKTPRVEPATGVTVGTAMEGILKNGSRTVVGRSPTDSGDHVV
ncbi:Amphoterin-induced protein 2 [Merluccius polli]|uniref:Amphoterin-induced protein 2 n=1 Tax=Merluccius polli TaxID=89951 RepID=A0AA47N7E1_MERPO|nr:Amphoterin-induced protein 2 [Merluccius polli]